MAVAATDAHLRMAAFLDDPAGAVADLRDFVATEPARQDLFTPLIFAHWAGYYGDAPMALALLRRIPRQFFTGDVALALWRPPFSDMRGLPEFKEFALKSLVAQGGIVGWTCKSDALLEMMAKETPGQSSPYKAA